MDHSSHGGHHMSSPPVTSTGSSLTMDSGSSHGLHGASGPSAEPHGMMMYFHFGLGDRVLFYDWFCPMFP